MDTNYLLDIQESSVNIQEYPLISKSIHQYPRVSINIQGYPLISKSYTFIVYPSVASYFWIDTL